MTDTAYAPPRRQRGVTLVSALVAFLVVAVGLLAAMRAQSQFRAAGDEARHRTEATRLAQAELERLRAFPRLAAGADGAGFDAIDTGSLDATPAGSATAYTLTRSVTTSASPGHKTVQVALSWADRRGAVQQVRLTSLIARRDPALGGALTLPAHGSSQARVLGRDPRVPPAARDIGRGLSLLALGGATAQAVLIDNDSGAVTAVCAAPAGRPTGALDAADLAACRPLPGLLLTGRVRFSVGALPSALAPNDAPLAFDMALALTSPGAVAPVCGTEAHAGGDGERWVDYACLVAPSDAAAGWSGRAELLPAGWRVGIAAGDYRVCRYAADHDASGAVDRAVEHPADYRGVGASLAQQNFLVVAGVQACPTGAPVEVDGRGAENHADLSTVQHQP